MSIVKILVPVTGTEHDDPALAAAFLLAHEFATHVEALFIHRDPREVVPYSQMSLRPDIVQNLVDIEEEFQKTAAQTAYRNFSAAAEEYKVKVVDTPVCSSIATANYREIMGHLGHIAAKEALLSDLVVFPPILSGDATNIHDAIVRVLTKAGRPVLLAPAKKPKQIGHSVAIGWDGRSAAARALFAAMPILEKAQTVRLLTIGSAARDGCSTAAARRYLELHEIHSSELTIEGGLRPIADQLLDAAIYNGFDLLVIGGYGHSRIMESVFGGVTEDIVSHPQIPILMMH